MFGNAPAPPRREEPKHLISTHWWDCLYWHIPTVVALAATAVLLWLNFSQYAIGAEIGKSAQDSANTLGTLQFAIKIHELFIVASLVTIARQMIIGNLMKNGIILGLLGAESAFTAPTFVFSAGYVQSLAFIFGGRTVERNPNTIAVQRRVFGISLFVTLSWLVAGLAGPASGVLMIPRVDWRLFAERSFTPTANGTSPNILIGTRGPGFFSNVFEYPLSDAPGFKYWELYAENAAWNHTIAGDDDLNHRYGDVGHIQYVNTTGLYGRDLNAPWTGGTSIRCGIQSESHPIEDNTWGTLPMNTTGEGWRAVKSTRNIVALDALVVCRARQRIQCSTAAPLSSNSSSPDWCYMSVEYSPTTPGVVRSSRNLLLAADFGAVGSSRVWITEGIKIAANNHYSDSLEVIFEPSPPVPAANHTATESSPSASLNLTVCTFSGTLVAGIGTALGTHFTIEKIEYFDYAIKPDGKHASPRKLLFHENWLDRAFAVGGPLWANLSTTYPDPFSYPPRPATIPPLDNTLAGFGNGSRDAVAYYKGNEALPIEVTVGGLLAYLLSWTPGSDSQYAMAYDDIPARFTAGLGPRESWSTASLYQVYQEGYMFHLSTRTGYLGVAVLCLHAVVAVVASLWQLLITRTVVLGWTTTPEYMMLGAGSTALTESYPNSCAGIGAAKALGSIIVLKTTKSEAPEAVGGKLKEVASTTPGSQESLPLHLELVEGDSERGMDTDAVDVANTRVKYGFLPARRRAAYGTSET